MVSNRFRWVFCQLEALQDCLPSSVRRTLKDLPESLDETYERILREIKRPSRDHARRLLQCLVVAIRPLYVEELAELLAYDFDATEGGIPKVNPNWRWEDHEQAVLSTCSSLIAVVSDEGRRVVQFSHFSVKEFLTSSRLAISGEDVAHHCISLELAHTLLAQACLGTLLSLENNAGSDGSSFPLAGYAARHWVAHAQVDKVSPRVQAGMQQLFDPSKTHFSSWIQLNDPDEYLGSIDMPLIDPIAASLYYAALCGFRELVVHLLIEYPEHVDTFGGGRGAPLHAASALNRVEVAQLLLEGGGDTDVRGDLKQAPLHFAAMAGHLEMVRFLLDHGADVDSRREDLWTPLHIAAWNGYANIAQALLEHKADVNFRVDTGWVPLHGGCSHPGVVQVLLEHGADVGKKCEDGTTPLHLASSYGSTEVVLLLLDHGTNVDAVDQRGETPLHLAVSHGRKEVVRLLLDYGANTDAEDERGMAPLQAALEYGEEEIVQMLTEHGAQLHREL